VAGEIKESLRLSSVGRGDRAHTRKRWLGGNFYYLAPSEQLLRTEEKEPPPRQFRQEFKATEISNCTAGAKRDREQQNRGKIPVGQWSTREKVGLYKEKMTLQRRGGDWTRNEPLRYGRWGGKLPF